MNENPQNDLEGELRELEAAEEQQRLARILEVVLWRIEQEKPEAQPDRDVWNLDDIDWGTA